MRRTLNNKNNTKPQAMLVFLLLILLPPLAVIPIINRTVADPPPEDHLAWARAAVKLRNYPVAKAHLAQLIEASSRNPSNCSRRSL